MQGIMHLFLGIIRMIVIKSILIRTINASYMCELRNNIIQKKTLIIPSISSCIGIIAKLNITFITFNEKNKKKILFNLMKKKMTETCH